MASPKPWGGRFKEDTDEVVERFTASIDTDRHIAEDDVQGSIAHAQMLSEVGLVSPEDRVAIIEGLEQILVEIQESRFEWDPKLEDVHMNVERRLAALAGEDAAGRLHTARSRNDQVALDERLYLRRQLGTIRAHLLDLERSLIEQATDHVDTLMPGYTHLQRAQPVRLAHHLLAYREMFARDRGRIDDALVRALVSPLGAGALAATPHPIARGRVAKQLGLPAVTNNSIDAVSDRDALLEAMSAASISMVHLSRLCEELVLWSSVEFRFCEIGDAFTTGSSMMPQKKNPDVAELVRGKCGRVIGDLVALLVTMKALPLAYNRDMQEDKPSLVDSLSTWAASVEVMARMIPEITFYKTRMREALSEGFVTATELADYLVGRGVAFRHAHGVVGQIVASCIDTGRRLEDLTAAELTQFDSRFGEDAHEWLDPVTAIERRDVPGGPARRRVLEVLKKASAQIEAATEDAD